MRRSSQSLSLESSRSVTCAIMLLVTSATTFLPISMLCWVSRARMSSKVMLVIAAELEAGGMQTGTFTADYAGA
eukprot:2560980-Heterocapsa_arctica.AAC.1